MAAIRSGMTLFEVVGHHHLTAAVATDPTFSDTDLLDADKRDWIRRAVEKARITATPVLLARLTAVVEACIARYHTRRRTRTTPRDRHKSLRELLKLAASPDPPIAQIRYRIGRLPSQTIDDLNERMFAIWSRVFRGQTPPPEGIVAWSQTAAPAQLVEMVRSLVPDGGRVVPGRKRPGGKQSAPTLEPLLVGSPLGPGNRRSGRTSSDGTETAKVHGDGRPHADAADALAEDLAFVWAVATGQMPEHGRSGDTGFGDLVHHVFSWVGCPTPEQSLRRYWAEVDDAEIIATETGIIYR